MLSSVFISTRITALAPASDLRNCRFGHRIRASPSARHYAIQLQLRTKNLGNLHSRFWKPSRIGRFQTELGPQTHPTGSSWRMFCMVYFRLCDRAHGSESSILEVLSGPFLPQNPVEKVGASPTTFSSGFFGRRGPLRFPSMDDFQPGCSIA